MTVRVPWEDQYALSYATGEAIGLHDAATAGVFTIAQDGIAAIGPAGKCGLLLDEHPTINPGVEINSVEKATGLSQPQTGTAGIGVELNIARKLPTFSIGSMGLTPEKTEVFLWSLFQKGSSETGIGPYAKVYIPYVQGQPDTEMFIHISRSIGDPASATGYGHAMFGSIVTSFGISGSQGERWTVSAELMGRTFRSDYIHTASDLTAETTVDHVFLDYTWSIGGNAANLQSLDLTIVNNAVAAAYNSLVPSAYTLHRLAASGTFALAMSTATIGDNTQIDTFVAGNDTLIVGTGPSSSIVWTVNARYTGAEVDPAEVELLLNLPYEGVYDGTNHAIQVDVSSLIQRGIPA